MIFIEKVKITVRVLEVHRMKTVMENKQNKNLTQYNDIWKKKETKIKVMLRQKGDPHIQTDRQTDKQRRTKRLQID